MESNKPKIKAQRKPFILMPETNLSASSIMITLITKRKRPKVIIVRGSVKRTNNGFRIKLRTAKTNAKIIAVVNELMATCGANNFEIT